MAILQQEKEKLAKAREDKPAATEVFGKGEGRTFTIDAKASHNRLALEALATGQLPTFSAATIDVDDLKRNWAPTRRRETVWNSCRTSTGVSPRQSS